MTKEHLLVRTKDNFVKSITIEYNNLDTRSQLIDACEQEALKHSYNDRIRLPRGCQITEADEEITAFIKNEVSGYHYERRPHDFVNGLRDNSNVPYDKRGDMNFDYSLPDSLFSGIIENIGYKIIPDDRAYDLRYNKKENKYETYPEWNTNIALVDYKSRQLKVARNHFRLSDEDKRIFSDLLQQYRNARSVDHYLTPSDFADRIRDFRARDLFKIYAREYTVAANADVIISHELHHIKNDVFISGLSLKEDAKRMSVEDMFRICVEHERSAYIEQLVQCVNVYLQKGDYNDFSMFDEECRFIAEDLSKMKTAAERKAYVCDWDNLVAKMHEKFKTGHYNWYVENQFGRNLDDMIDRTQRTADFDSDRRYYKRLRSLFYQYQIYNPDSGKFESRNLADCIREEASIDENIVAAGKRRMQSRMNTLDSEKYGRDVVEQAKKMMRQGMQSSAFINEIDNMRVSQLYDEMQYNRDVPIKDPRWNKELKDYWKNIEGYKEIRKDVREYRFQINNTTIMYLDKDNVSISNADYRVYEAMLKSPGHESKTVEFLSTLNEEQRLTLYVACINNGYVPVGNLPKSLDGLENLQIPPQALAKFRELEAENRGPASPLEHSGGSVHHLHQADEPARQQALNPVLQKMMAMRRGK